MKYSILVVIVITLLTSLPLKTASAALLTIDLDSACAVASSPCVIPTGGVLVDDFITLSSSDGALAYNPSTSSYDGIVSFEGPGETTVDFAFDETQALVTDISFSGHAGGGDLTYTVFETDAIFSTHTDTGDFTAAITGYDSIIRLRLSAFEGSADNFAITYTVVPIPPSVWLFGSGMLGLAAIARRRARSS